VDLTEEVNNTVSINWSAYYPSQKRSRPFDILAASPSRWGPFRCHREARLSKDQRNSTFSESWTDPCGRSCSPNPMEEAKPPRGLGHLDVWSHSYRNGCTEIHRNFTSLGGQALLLRQGLPQLVLLRHPSASSVTRTRQSHQITACYLYKLRVSTYDSYSRDAS